MDFEFTNFGSIMTVKPLNDAARAHLTENVSEEATWWGGALVVEPRYARDLADALLNEGWECQ